MPEFRIGDEITGPGHKPFIIAEAGVNHECDLGTAEQMVREAATAGADAIKFQTFKAERLAASESPTYWEQEGSQQQYFKRYDLFGEQEYNRLALLSRENGIVFLSTPFDLEAVDMLDPLVPAYKVASADITNVQLLRHIARKRKPVILSTGASTLQEIAAAVDLLEAEGAPQVAVLHCILHYPTNYEEANLRSIEYLAGAFPDCVVGYSDHTLPDDGMAVVTAAAMLGAYIIEKHFTLNKALPGNDHYHAMDPTDLRRLRRNIDVIWAAMGERRRHVLPAEEAARAYARRSLVATRRIAAGEVISADAITAKRPGTGIGAQYFDMVLGRRAVREIPPDTILAWDMFA